MRRAKDERGVIFPFVALMLALLLVIAAFTVDIGMQRVARRDMQALADAVALDLARLIDGRSAQDIGAGGAGKLSLATALAQSKDRNDDDTLGDPPTVTAQLVDLDADNRPVTVNGVVQEVSGTAAPEAVLVTARTAVDFAFTTGSGGASRTAIGNSQSVACFRLGSYALALSSGNSALLDSLVGDALDVSALSYTGLANASITLLELAGQLGVGTVDALIALNNVRLADLYLASARALQARGGDAADVTVLNALAAKVSSTATIAFASLVNISSGNNAALASSLNLLDLVAGSAFLVNGTNLLAASLLIREPKISQPASVDFRVIEQPQMACGSVGVVAKTAQMKLATTLPLHQFTLSGLGLQSSETNIVVDVDLASATGQLAVIDCGAATLSDPESIDVAVTRSLGRAAMTAPVHLSGDVKATDLGLSGTILGIPILSSTKVTLAMDVALGTSASAPAYTSTATYTVPPHTYAEPQTAGTSGGVVLPSVVLDSTDVTNVVAKIGGVAITLPASSITTVLNQLTTDIVTDALNPLVTSLNSILTPTAQLLGIHAAGADLYGIARPSCDSPALRG